MIVLGAVLAAGLLLLVLGAPGYVVGRALVPAAHGPDRHVVTAICGFSVVPLFYFLVAVGAGVPIDRPLLLILAAAVVAGTVTVTRRWRPDDIGPRDTAAVALTALGATVLVAFTVRALDGGDVFATLQHCLYVIVMHTVANHPAEALPLYDHLSGGDMHMLVHHTTSQFGGLAPLFHEQRLGNSAIMAPHVALVGSAGWYTVCIHAYTVIAVCTFAAARRAGAGAWPAAVGSAVLLLGLQTICAYTVNENMFAAAIVAFLLWASLAPEPPRGMVILIGLVAGHLIGVRHTSALFWPAVFIALWWGPGARRRRLLLAGAAATATVLPWLYVNAIMLGSPLSHPKVIDDSDGRVVQNAWLGMEFTFKALNWPFTDRVVRTAWNPFPTFIWLPLLALRAFGQLAGALAVLGLKAPTRRTTVLLLLFAVPHSAAIAWLELLDWEQISYATPGLVPFGVWLALGIEALRPASGRLRRLAVAGAVLAAIVGASFGLRAARFPVDMRGLSAEHWPEPPAEDAGVQAVRQQLTGFYPLPRRPVMRGVVAQQLGGALGALVTDSGARRDGPLPAYPSGQAGILVGYAEDGPREYTFSLLPRPAREPGSPVRTGVSVHTVALRLAAERVDVTVTRFHGRYAVDVVPHGTSDAARDFTFYITPWRPFARELSVTLAGEPLPSLRVLRYGGRVEDGEAVYLATNYASEVIALREITLDVEPLGEPHFCGWLVFGAGHDFSRIETLVLAGGHVQSWQGDLTQPLVLPENLIADQLLLFSEPYCSSHVPQYGDRYGLIAVPDTDRVPIRLESLWLEGGSIQVDRP